MCMFWFQHFLYFLRYWNIGCMHRSIGDMLPLWTVRYGQQRMNSPYPVISLQTQTTKYFDLNTNCEEKHMFIQQLVISIIHKCLEFQKSHKSNSRIPCAVDQGSHLYMSDMCPKWGYICQTVFYLTPTQLMQCQTFYRQHFLTLAFQTCPLRWELFCNSGFHTAAVGRMFISLWHFTWKHISTDFENSQQGIQIFQWNSFCGNFSNWVNIPH